jgi:hypothetical protein
MQHSDRWICMHSSWWTRTVGFPCALRDELGPLDSHALFVMSSDRWIRMHSLWWTWQHEDLTWVPVHGNILGCEIRRWATNGETRLLVTDEPVLNLRSDVFKLKISGKLITDPFGGVYREFSILRKMSTCNRLVLGTLARISTDYAQKSLRTFYVSEWVSDFGMWSCELD